MIVNLPSQEELEDANRQLQEAKEAKNKSKWSFGSSGGSKQIRSPAPPVDEVEKKLSESKME